MSTRTSDDYKKAVLAQYEIAKKGVYAGYLNDPTPASLKSLALMCFDNSGKADHEIFQHFFHFNPEKDKRKQIQDFDPDAFRSLCSFVKRKNSPRKREGVDLMAVFVDFKERPLNKFLNNNIETTKTNNDFPDDNNTGIAPVPEEIYPPQKKRNKLLILYFLIITVIIIISNLLFDEENCMVWNNDHYEEVDCDTQKTQFLFNPPIIAFDKETYKYLKKIKVSDTTTFFNPDGSPRIWYGKSANKEYEYFTYFGKHPETGKALKDMTPYLVDKYVKNKKQ